MSQSLGLGVACREVALIDIHRASTSLAEEVELLPIWSIEWVAILRRVLQDVAVGLLVQIILHEVTSHRRGMVLTPFVLKTLDVLIEDAPTICTHADRLCGRSE